MHALEQILQRILAAAVVVVVVVKFFNKNFVKRKVENIDIQYRHTIATTM